MDKYPRKQNKSSAGRVRSKNRFEREPDRTERQVQVQGSEISCLEPNARFSVRVARGRSNPEPNSNLKNPTRGDSLHLSMPWVQIWTSSGCRNDESPHVTLCPLTTIGTLMCNFEMAVSPLSQIGSAFGENGPEPEPNRTCPALNKSEDDRSRDGKEVRGGWAGSSPTSASSAGADPHLRALLTGAYTTSAARTFGVGSRRSGAALPAVAVPGVVADGGEDEHVREERDGCALEPARARLVGREDAMSCASSSHARRPRRARLFSGRSSSGAELALAYVEDWGAKKGWEKGFANTQRASRADLGTRHQPATQAAAHARSRGRRSACGMRCPCAAGSKGRRARRFDLSRGEPRARECRGWNGTDGGGG
ncbi:hypothetical protein FB451DRAFT_1198206 [Mycena latifolia]|nr:hypothetical protein FB451DRAFT_1198206 [Mycena latifolia]